MAPDQIWPIGLAMPLPAMSGALPCTGSNIEGKARSGLMLPPGAMAIVPVVAGPRSERMSPNRLEPTITSNQCGIAHEVRGQDVDVELVGLDVRVLLGDRREALVPIGHGDRDAVRLGGGDDLAALARHGEIEGVAHDALAALLGEDGGLDRPFELGALVHAPADRGILALVVLAHDEVVDVAGLAVGERRLEAVEEAHGAQIDVLLEAAADRDQQAPQRDVIGHARPAHRAQVDRVVLGDLVEPVGRHHGAGLGEALARPVQMVPGVVDAEAGAHRLQHADALRHHLVADAVAGDDGDAEFVGRLRRGRRAHRILLALLRSAERACLPQQLKRWRRGPWP